MAILMQKVMFYWGVRCLFLMKLRISVNHYRSNDCLVGGFKHFLFSIIYGIILPIDELVFFKMVKTTNQLHVWSSCVCGPL